MSAPDVGPKNIRCNTSSAMSASCAHYVPRYWTCSDKGVDPWADSPGALTQPDGAVCNIGTGCHSVPSKKDVLPLPRNKDGSPTRRARAGSRIGSMLKACDYEPAPPEPSKQPTSAETPSSNALKFSKRQLVLAFGIAGISDAIGALITPLPPIGWVVDFATRCCFSWC